MRLAKVTLAGFKSFAEPTEFRFDLPITGIVGPNGCGKSNVVDAIKWVLGERSAKSLRGEAMMDVIFAGSAGRKALGAASVTLTFENPVVRPDTADPAQRRFLAVDTPEVDVTRRLYRDGRSEYLINARKCRLRDIKELFLDTGVGTNAYAIIEQGRVDAMLLANPVERRAIFEEAAGIARFKARKIESQRKLEKSEVNLLRVREQLASTDRRLRIVRSQAEKARRFQELDARSRHLRRETALDAYHELRVTLEGLTSRITDLGRQRTALQSELGEAETTRSEAEHRRTALEHARREAEQTRMEATGRKRQAEQRRDMTQRHLHDAQHHVAEERTRLAALDERLSELARELQAISAAIDLCAAEVTEAEEGVASLQKLRAERQEAVSSMRDREGRLRESLGRADLRCKRNAQPRRSRSRRSGARAE